MRPASNSVFLNLPFEPAYEQIFVGYLVGLITLGLVPRSVIELNEDGEGRMGRLFRLLASCDASIHDLSYHGRETRHNMPFELGVAYAISRLGAKHTLVVFESRRRDLLRTLSDLRGFDPKLHHMRGEEALAVIYECFISPTIEDAEVKGGRIYRAIMAALPQFRGNCSTIFNRRSLQLLIHFISQRASLGSQSREDRPS